MGIANILKSDPMWQIFSPGILVETPGFYAPRNSSIWQENRAIYCADVYTYTVIYTHYDYIYIYLLVYIYNILSRTECIYIYCSYYIWFRNDSIYTSICLHTNTCNSLSKFFPSMLFLFTRLRKPFLLHSKKLGVVHFDRWTVDLSRVLKFPGKRRTHWTTNTRTVNASSLRHFQSRCETGTLHRDSGNDPGWC